MANIATCPKCAKQLGLPAAFEAVDRAECPECLAVFSLSDAVQISLPVVRVLDPTESAAEMASSTKPVLEVANTEELASNSAPLKSWEERLKNALALDGSNDSAAIDGATNDQTSEVKNTQSPSIDFELDPVSATKAQPKQGTLDLEVPEIVPHVISPAATKPTIERKKAHSKPLADFASGELASASGLPASPTSKAQQAPAENAANATNTIKPRRVARRGIPKIAAFAAGPVMGSLLGLYGLLWLQGTQSDYLGLARVLPKSMLPLRLDEVSGESMIAEASSQEAIKHDAAVMPASADQPLPNDASKLRIKPDEFYALVDAATAALPEFVAGDLSTDAAIKRKGQAYMALCRLAAHFDFAHQPGLAPAVEARAGQAAELYQRAASQADVRQDLAHIAGRWWEYEQRPSSGIFMAGQVQASEPAGSGTLCWLKLSEQSTVETIPVWFKSGHYQTGDQIGVVGSVVTQPSDLPPGFSGQQLVAAEYAFTLQK